jgi:hypothetical protein
MYRLIALFMYSWVGHPMYIKPLVVGYEEVIEQTKLLGDTRKVVEKKYEG